MFDSLENAFVVILSAFGAALNAEDSHPLLANSARRTSKFQWVIARPATVTAG
jgi:hypothetical protein